MENKLSFCIDYLNGIVPITAVDSFFESLRSINEDFSLENWVSSSFAVRGIRNYNSRFHFLGRNDFIISWNALNEDEQFTAKNPKENKFNPYIYITLSGNGLKYFSDYEREQFFKYLFRCRFQCTRLDVACDIFNRDNQIVDLFIQSFKNSALPVKPEGVPFISSAMSLKPKKIKSSGRCVRPVQFTTISDNDGNFYENLTFGNHGSTLGMLRVYNKYLERGLDNTFYSDVLSQFHKNMYPDCYWYRIEVELHHKHSNNLFNLFVGKSLEYYDLFASALVSMIDIRVSRSFGYRVNECSVSPVFSEFLSELSNNIHFVELDKEEYVPIVQLPIEELKERFKHYAPMLCGFIDLCFIDNSFLESIVIGERYRYENKIQYEFLRRQVIKSDKDLINNILNFNERRCKYGI